MELWGPPQTENPPEVEGSPEQVELRRDHFPITSFGYLDQAIPEANNLWTFHL